MNSTLLTLIVLNLMVAKSFAQVINPIWDLKHFPDPDRTYLSNQDHSMTPYRFRELYHSGKLILTFDDGPHSINTEAILDLLAIYKIQAIFFVLTSKIHESTRPLIKRIVKEGHFLASHGLHHENTNSLSKEEFKEQFKQSILHLEEILSEVDLDGYESEQKNKGFYYRFPYGSFGRHQDYHHFHALQEVSDELYGKGSNCFNFVFWDIDSLDWAVQRKVDYDPSMIVTHLWGQIFGGMAYNLNRDHSLSPITVPLSRALGGGVALFHDIHSKTVVALESFLKENSLRTHHLTFAHPWEAKDLDQRAKECVFLNSHHD
jgi:peptidoglycan/xylan/chitin deacetylase (PgdA/CDA1 family)